MSAPIFAELVTRPDDIVGALAYALYKRTKVEWRATLGRAHAGAGPTEVEEAVFYAQNMLRIQLQAYRDRADALVTAFLDTATGQKLDLLGPEVVQSVLVETFQVSQHSVVTELTALRAALQAKRGIGGWLAEAGSSFLVNVLVIVFIGVIVIGYQHSALINAWFEQRLQVAPTPAPAQPTVNAPAPPSR